MKNPCVDIAAHLLGALDEEEDRAYSVHLATCADCQAEAALAGVVTHLHRIDAAEIDTPEIDTPEIDTAEIETTARPSAKIEAEIGTVSDLSTVRAASRRRRWTAAIAGGAVAAAAAVVLLLTSVLSQPAPSTIETVAIDQVFPGTGANVIRVQVSNQRSISDIAVFCEIVDPGSGYQSGQMALWIRTDDGGETKVVSWPMKVGSSEYRAAAPVASNDIQVLELRDADGGLLSAIPA